MADRAEFYPARSLRIATVLALAAACAACASVGDPVGFANNTQDKYDFSTCPEIIGARTALTNREKELAGLAEKAESAPGGIVVSYAAYRAELSNTRAQLRTADRAARMKNCDAKPKG